MEDDANVGIVQADVKSRKFELDFLEESSDESLLAELRRIAAMLPNGKHLGSADYEMLCPKVSHMTLRRRFGSWSEVLNRAGLDRLHKSRTFTDIQRFENLVSVWTHYGRTPSYREMFEQPSAIPGKTYLYRWGTWRKALIAFAQWTDAESQEIERQAAPNLIGALDQLTDRDVKRQEADVRDVRPGLRYKVFKRDNFRCVVCGRSPATHLNVELHADHILAVANGGKTTFENLRSLCQDCNFGKGKT